MLLARDRFAVAVRFAIELDALFLRDYTVGLRFFLVLLQLVFALFETVGFALGQFAGFHTLFDAFFLVGLALVDAGRRGLGKGAAREGEGVPPPIIWTRFSNSGRHLLSMRLTDFKG